MNRRLNERTRNSGVDGSTTRFSIEVELMAALFGVASFNACPRSRGSRLLLHERAVGHRPARALDDRGRGAEHALEQGLDLLATRWGDFELEPLRLVAEVPVL